MTATGPTGLYYARNRHYSPTHGRWIQRDPNETALPVMTAMAFNGMNAFGYSGGLSLEDHYADGMNVYQFGSGNPLTRRDALGLDDYFDEIESFADDKTGNAIYVLGTISEKIEAFTPALLMIASFLPGSQIFTLANIARNGVGGFWGAIELAVDLIPGGKLGKAFGRAFKWRWAAKIGKGALHLTGQLHHAISKRVWKALEQHPNLKGLYKYQDPRFVTQALDEAAHRGYQKWHRAIDAEVAQKIENSPHMSAGDFEAYLKNLYNTDPRLTPRFPKGL